MSLELRPDEQGETVPGLDPAREVAPLTYVGDKRAMLGERRGDFVAVAVAWSAPRNRTRVFYALATLDDIAAELRTHLSPPAVAGLLGIGAARPKKRNR